MSTDVVFTYVTPKGEKKSQTLRWDDKINSREALGLWKVKDEAWKVYRQRNQLPALREDYARATNDVALPMGSPTFVEGLVEHKGQRTEGFVLVTDWMVGKNFQKTASSFKSALSAENMPHNATDQDYLKTKRPCLGAQTIGLRDCQGFVKTGMGAKFDTLRFIDIHTGWNAQKKKYDPSGLADDLVDVIEKWAK